MKQSAPIEQNASLHSYAALRNASLADFVEWDVRNWSAALDFWLAHTKQDISKCSALEIGSRNGGLSLWLALQGARVVCSDIHMPGENAMQRHRASGVSHLVEYESIDAMDIPYSNRFDLIVFKSVLGTVGSPSTKEKQARAIAEMHRALKKGGELFFAENLAGSALHRFFRRGFVEWANRWRYVTVAEMEQYLSPFYSVQYSSIGFAGAFGRRESQRNLMGLLDQKVLNHVLPSNWKYIIAGVAVK